MNVVPISSLLVSPARLATLTAKRRGQVELLDEGDLRNLVRLMAAKYPLVFDAAWRELTGGTS